MSERLIFMQTPLSGVWIAKRKILEDNRGAFSRLFCADEFREIGLDKPIVQINHSITKIKGAVRGLHFQYPPHAETKIVSCLKGEIFDVAVDLRQGSETFLSWHGERLSAKNQKSIIIPEGFAHGFQILEDECELLYFHTAFYSKEKESAIHYADPKIGISWPLPVTNISEKDKTYPFIENNFKGIVL